MIMLSSNFNQLKFYFSPHIWRNTYLRPTISSIDLIYWYWLAYRYKFSISFSIFFKLFFNLLIILKHLEVFLPFLIQICLSCIQIGLQMIDVRPWAVELLIECILVWSITFENLIMKSPFSSLVIVSINLSAIVSNQSIDVLLASKCHPFELF